MLTEKTCTEAPDENQDLLNSVRSCRVSNSISWSAEQLQCPLSHEVPAIVYVECRRPIHAISKHPAFYRLERRQRHTPCQLMIIGVVYPYQDPIV